MPELGEEHRLQAIRAGARLLIAHGPAAWPGATYLLLLEVDRFGSLTGAAAVVSRACAREAAARVLARLDELDATDSCRDGLPYLDLVGNSGPPDGPGSICGDCV